MEIKKVNELMARWQRDLGDEVEVVLGGSLASDLFVFDEEAKVVDVDVRFLVDNPEDKGICKKIEAVTGLAYRKTIAVEDWPSNSPSPGIMVEGKIEMEGIPLPLDIEGCIRNRKYVGWARFYRQVLSPEEIRDFIKKKKMLRGNKAEYKKMKSEIRAEVERRCIEKGFVNTSL